MESIVAPVVLKEGSLGKMGGGAGGHKNWKDRYFVLSDHLYYFESKQVRGGCVAGRHSRRRATAVLAPGRRLRRVGCVGATMRR